MLKNIFMWILTNVFKVQTETTQKEVADNQAYASNYEDIQNINFNAIFSNKLANYTINDSDINIEGENVRADLINKTAQSMWKKMKKITSMALGYGGVLVVPYVKTGKIYYSLVPQNRMAINKMEGDIIVSATILAEKRTISTQSSNLVYLRWTDYTIENGNLIITQEFTDENEHKIAVPAFWKNIQQKQVITGVDRVLFGYIKSPINNRKSNDKYGVPITYGCESTIKEIKETLLQIAEEYDLKRCFVGVDVAMFNGENKLPTNGLFKKLDTNKDEFFEVFDPAFRETALFARLQELYQRLEKQIGTSKGILSEVETQNATATEIKRAMYDTFVIVDDMRALIEKGLEDFFYSCNVLANAYNLSAQGEYSVNYNWSYGLIEDPAQEFSQLMQGYNAGVIE